MRPKAAQLGAEEALFIDKDLTITHPDVENFSAIDGDVVYCRCRICTAALWARVDSFHTTFWFAGIKVFRTSSPPCFQLVHTPNCCELVKCECRFFRDQTMPEKFRGHEERTG